MSGAETPLALHGHDRYQLQKIADAAQTAADLALNRQDDSVDDEYVDPARLDEAYAAGVEDVLRWLAGDAAPTEALALVLAAGDAEAVTR